VAASITFNDGSGAQTITPSPSVSRFNRWNPDTVPIGEEAIEWGSGRGHRWTGRDDFLVQLELPHINHTEESKLQDFLVHANRFGVFTITTGDSESNVFTDCQIAPGTRAEISDPDPETLEITLRLTAISVATVPVRFRRVHT
jgi:hypothetical protein